MTPFGAYRCYLALKQHFNNDRYDIIKYQGKTSATVASFEKRKDRYRFEKMAMNMKTEDIVDTFIANFVHDIRYSGPFDDQTESRYKKWLAHQQALTYNFGNEVKELFSVAKETNLCYNDVFFSREVGQHPPVLVEYLAKTVSLESFIILDRLNSFTGQMSNDVMTEGIIRLARKYDPFLKVDLDVYGNITQRIREDIFA